MTIVTAELIAHIEAQNEEARQWAAEAPGRIVGMVTTCPDHWAEYDIYTVEQYEHYMAVEMLHDVVKSEMGIRPRWMDTDSMSVEDIYQAIDFYTGESEWISKAAEEAARKRAYSNRYRPNRELQIKLSRAIALAS